MIKVMELANTDANPNNYRISAFADTKEEVDSGEFIGLPEGAEIEMGSTIITAAGEVAFRKSDGSWSWA